MHYNFLDIKNKKIFSVQPKCGSLTVKSIILLNNDYKKIDDAMISTEELQNHSYEKIMIVRNLYDRLISFYNLFVVNKVYKDLWMHADKNKYFTLKNKSFRQFIDILKILAQKNYQHHLIPQTFNIDINVYDEIINIKNFNHYLIENNIPTIDKIANEQNKINYQQSVIDLKPKQFNRKLVPIYENFYDQELTAIINQHIYPRDYKLLNKYFV